MKPRVRLLPLALLSGSLFAPGFINGFIAASISVEGPVILPLTAILWCAQSGAPASAAQNDLKARVVSVSRPVKAGIGCYPPPCPVRWEEAPKGKRWLHIIVGFRTTKEGYSIPVKEMKLIDGSSLEYPASGLDMGARNKSGGPFDDSRALKEFFMMQAGPQKLGLLFAVPITAKRLYLQLGESTRILVALTPKRR